MKPLKIITATSPGGSLPIEFPEDTGIEPFDLPLITLIDRKVMDQCDKWIERENTKRAEADPKRPNVTNYDMCEYLLPKLIDADTAKKVLARPVGELRQLWETWLTSDPSTAPDLGE